MGCAAYCCALKQALKHGSGTAPAADKVNNDFDDDVGFDWFEDVIQIHEMEVCCCVPKVVKIGVKARAKANKLTIERTIRNMTPFTLRSQIPGVFMQPLHFVT
jgi:hypothetical protein